ncbi:MAG: hypothetical protein HXS41_09340 [Theionarchaea archaeon]|nr:hypothetical protein [Theionarchaea archaeon]MBU7000409.1 hypothetical protein [Theionarchaea archaeon]MBU7021251.1 hypothetical protein [Theionarchaea archaeon]MBU7035306.1 hypothetical protein [Theionarchaea archaeon]MBU7039743.1 hypothetical protein [Theionarchaea archaeon]
MESENHIYPGGKGNVGCRRMGTLTATGAYCGGLPLRCSLSFSGVYREQKGLEVIFLRTT